jgi:hypothetical protein
VYSNIEIMLYIYPPLLYGFLQDGVALPDALAYPMR